MAKEITYFVSLNGNDAWSGSRPDSNRSKTDGPLATVGEALARVAKTKSSPKNVRIVLRAGRHELRTSLAISPTMAGRQKWLRETGQETIPVEEGYLRFEAYPYEEPVLSGGRTIRQWTPVIINGQNGWSAEWPSKGKVGMPCHQLFINGQRRQRARWPKKGFLRVSEIPGWKAVKDQPAWMQGQNYFRFAKEDLKPWTNLKDTEIVFLQRWIESRCRFKRLDFGQNLAYLDRSTYYSIIHDGTDPDKPQGARYYVENVLDELTEPGEWCWDRRQGKIYYLPMPGERLEDLDAVVSVLPWLVSLDGNQEKSEPVLNVHFENIHFTHTEWTHPAGISGCEQAACNTPGMVKLNHAKQCTFRNCTFQNTGAYGIEIVNGSSEIEITNCRFEDLGAGGVKIWHGCRRNLIADCQINGGGKIFHSGVGILIGKSSGNRILRNRIWDFYYTGISVGWVWGYRESDSYGNIIESNHVYDIGKDWLSDMGGIYLLGIAPGTRVRYNVVHHIQSGVYGGVGIYPDEGSSDLLIEGNLVFDCRSFLFSQHYGRRNLVRENLWIEGLENQLALHRIEPGQLALTFENNIVVFKNGALFSGGYMNQKLNPTTLVFCNNLYCTSARKLQFMGMNFSAWRKAGMDKNSRVIKHLSNETTGRLQRILGDLKKVPSMTEAIHRLSLMGYDILKYIGHEK